MKFDPEQRANIFGLSHMEDMFPITMGQKCIIVHTDKGDIRFERKDRLYCYTPKKGFFDHVERINNHNNKKFCTGQIPPNTGESTPTTGFQNGGTGLSTPNTGSHESGRTGQDENSTNAGPNSQPNKQLSGVVVQECHVIDSVKENVQGYTQRELQNAKKAREFYTMCMKPTVRNLKHLVNRNFVKSCPITINNINTAEKVYGPDVGTLKGKSVRRRLPVV